MHIRLGPKSATMIGLSALAVFDALIAIVQAAPSLSHELSDTTKSENADTLLNLASGKWGTQDPSFYCGWSRTFEKAIDQVFSMQSV